MSGSHSQSLRLGLWLRYWAGQRLAPFHGTPPHVVRRMLQLADVSASDRVVDLGCGDARLLIAAAKHHGAQGYGVELDPKLFLVGQQNVRSAGLGHMITIEQKDAMLADLSTASVVTLYLSVPGNRRLYPRLCELLPDGARVVSFWAPIEEAKPASITTVNGVKLYLYKFDSK